MGLKKLTEKKVATNLLDEAYVVVTQQITDDQGEAKEAVRRIPLATFFSTIGADVDFDQDEQALYLLNRDGVRIGVGTTIIAGITGLQMYTEEDDNATQYLVLADSNGVELCRTEFTVTGSGTGTAYTCRLINGMSSANLSVPSGQGCSLQYEYYEYYGQDRTTVDATAQYFVKTGTSDYQLVKTESINQGTHTVPVSEYLTTGVNYFKIQVAGGESGTIKTLTFTINVVDIALTSTFSDTQAYSSSISFLYRVTGKSLKKTMYFYVDGELYDEVDIGTSHNVQLTETLNLAKYGHGHHIMTCYFLTEDGARSPELTYDIMFTTGEEETIIGSTFSETEVTFGETITADYVVFTHGSDYTAEVLLGIYTLDAAGEKQYYSQTALSNVVNQSVQKWNITDYPESGKIYLEIAAGTTVRTFEVTVNAISGDRDLSGVDTRLIAAFSASGRSNNDTAREVLSAAYTSKDNVQTTIKGALSGFNYRSNGWVSDADGYPVLRISGGASAQINLPLFASSWKDDQNQDIQLAGSPTTAGRTFEISFRTQKVTDESKSIMTLYDEDSGIGVKIFPSRAYILSDAMSIEQDDEGNILNKNAIPYVPYSSTQGKVRLTFVVEQNGYYKEEDGTAKQLIRIYVNGEMASAIPYSTDSFTTSNAIPKLEAEGCIFDVYTMRFYDYALDDAGVLKNFIADLPSTSEKIEVYDANDIVDDNDDIDFYLSIQKYASMVLTGTLSAYKGDKVKIGCQLYKPDGSTEDGYYIEWDYMEQDAEGKYGNVNNVQGTSSQYYLKKNYKITFYKLVNGEFKKVKVVIMPGMTPVNTICVKADYMSPDSANTGNANYWQSILEEQTPQQKENAAYQTSIKGYPILMFHRETEGDTPTFIGRYCLNNDKSNAEAFGLVTEGDSGNNTVCQMWEYLDNAEDICNWKTDKLQEPRTDKDGKSYPAWMDALESSYPDQGDLEDEGLLPNLDRMQITYSWVVQRANYLAASKTSGGGTYNGVTYTNDYDLKLAIFRREFSRHFNAHHFAHYFIANEVPLIVDNFSKNFFAVPRTNNQRILNTDGEEITVASLIAEDGSVDISNVDWENSTFDPVYAMLYDMDSCLAADNNGYDQFPYYAEMWDSYNGSKIVNGSENILFQLWYGAFYDDLKNLYCRFRDTSKTLSPALYMRALIDDLTKAMPIVAINKDQRFKYIDAYEGGYFNYETESWLYTAAFMYLVKSTMESYHRDFITKRFAMLDSKYLEDSYLQDNFNFRINRGQSNPEDLAFEITPCQALYCYTEWGNSGSYIGGKCLEGESIEMKPTAAGNWSDIVLAVYGASHIKSLGDLSPLYPSKLQSLSLCQNLTELILGSNAEGYNNSLLTSISDVSYLTMLEKLNICNLTALGGTVDLSNCDVIEEVYATGSAIAAVVFPQGGYLKKVELPAGITSLEIVDHSEMQHFTMESYANILRLRVENTPNIDTAAIIATRGASLNRIRLVGVNWTLADETVLRIIADDSMKGKVIDANGSAVEDTNSYPTITGTVTIGRIQKSLLDKLNSIYPNLNIRYTTLYHVATFKDWDGSVLKTEEVNDGESATAPVAPERANTVQYVYAFRGYDLNYGKITADTTFTALYSEALQQYDIEFRENQDDQAVLETVEGVSYGSSYTYPGELPTREGYLFVGWQDADGHVYNYKQQMPNDSASIDADGLPEVIKLFAAWEAVEMPATSKAFNQLTHGERLWCAIAIQRGEAEDCTVVYYSDTQEYIITNLTTLATVTIGAGDTKQYTLYNGETLTQQVADFNHDFLDSSKTGKAGISYMMENCLTKTGNMNPSYKHSFNYQIGNDEAIVNDDGDYANDTAASTVAKLNRTHVATEEEVAAGFVDVKSLGQTYLAGIEVSHADGTKTTWAFDSKGFYFGTDKDTVSDVIKENTWYKSDTDVDADNPFYKIGKMLQSAGVSIVNADGTVQTSWNATQYTWAYIIGKSMTFADFGGIKFDATGNDDLNVAANNGFNGNGKSRIVFCGDHTYGFNNFLEVSQGAVISVPVVEGDTVTVKAYGQSRNAGGYERTRMAKWANGEFLDQLPIGLLNTIIPVYKMTSIGNRSFTVTGKQYKMWQASYIEMGSGVTSYPFIQEGSRYPIFTDNASRIKYLADGTGAVCYWWERSPIRYYSGNFYFVSTSGYPYNNGSAGNAIGVCLGFCSGEASDSEA